MLVFLFLWPCVYMLWCTTDNWCCSQKLLLFVQKMVSPTFFFFFWKWSSYLEDRAAVALIFWNNQSSFILIGSTSLVPFRVTVQCSKRLQVQICLETLPKMLVQMNHLCIKTRKHKAFQHMRLSKEHRGYFLHRHKWQQSFIFPQHREEVQMLSSAATWNLVLSHLLVAASKTPFSHLWFTLAPFEFLHFLLCCDFHAISCLRATQSSIWEWEGNSTNLWKPVRFFNNETQQCEFLYLAGLHIRLNLFKEKNVCCAELDWLMQQLWLFFTKCSLDSVKLSDVLPSWRLSNSV